MSSVKQASESTQTPATLEQTGRSDRPLKAEADSLELWKEKTRQKDNQPEKQEPEAGDSLSSLISEALSGRSAAEAPGGAAVPPADPSLPLEGPDLQELVSRILVAEPSQDGQEEVRLILDDKVLMSTEIRLVRGGDGLLTVSLLTADPASFQTLVASQNALREALEAQESKGKGVRLVVTDTRADSGDGDPNQRSRGYAGYKGEDD